MTTPNGAARGVTQAERVVAETRRPAPIAPPPNPRQQAVTFALELAKIRASAGVAAEKITTAQQVVSDAEVFAAFIGKTP
jgi:hypothetical protein